MLEVISVSKDIIALSGEVLSREESDCHTCGQLLHNFIDFAPWRSHDLLE